LDRVGRVKRSQKVPFFGHELQEQKVHGAIQVLLESTETKKQKQPHVLGKGICFFLFCFPSQLGPKKMALVASS